MPFDKTSFYYKILIQTKVQYLILALYVLILYERAFSFDFCLDDYIITDTLAGKVTHLSDLWQLFNLSYNHTDYRPIVFLSFGLEQLFFGEIIPKYSHIINIFLFILILWSALKLFSLLFEKEDKIFLFLAVLLFCVHPLNTEVVCSLKCRDNLLSMLFGLNSSIFFIQFLLNKKYKWLRLLVFILFAVIGLLSKADAIGFLFFNVAYAVYYKKEAKIKYIIIALVCFGFVSNFISIFKDTMLNSNTAAVFTGKVTFTENPLVQYYTLENRLISFVNTVSFYFLKLIPISGLKFYYGYNQLNILSAATLNFYFGIFIIISLVLLFIYAIKYEHKIIVLTIAGIFLSSIYALNFFTPVAGIIADRYVFIANLFFCLLAIYCIKLVCIYFKKSNYFYAVYLTVSSILFVLTILRVPAWRNLKTLVDTDAPKLTNSYEAMRIAAGAYYQEYEKENDNFTRKKYLEKAISFAEKGIQVYPKNALLYLFLGQYYFKNDEPQNAIIAFKHSIQNDTSKTADAYIYLGDTYYHAHSIDSALLYYNMGLTVAPNSPILINNISTIYYDKNEKEKCLNFNLDLIKKDSTLYAAQENLGYFYLYQQDSSTAISYFKKAIKFGLDPSSLPIKIN